MPGQRGRETGRHIASRGNSGGMSLSSYDRSFAAARRFPARIPAGFREILGVIRSVTRLTGPGSAYNVEHGAEAAGDEHEAEAAEEA